MCFLVIPKKPKRDTSQKDAVNDHTSSCIGPDVGVQVLKAVSRVLDVVAVHVAALDGADAIRRGHALSDSDNVLEYISCGDTF